MGIARLQAATQEQMSFEFNNVSEHELNSVPPNTPYRPFSVESNFITDKIIVSIDIPWHEPIPYSVIVKLNNGNRECREIVINCNGHSSKTETDRLVIMHASPGRPRYGGCYIQTAEFVLNFGNYLKTLICPMSGTSIFSMCFVKAYDPQRNRFPTVYSYS
ncbi:MAG: hypothetical protein LBH25_05650 [Fibromonadaceae bacterium]|jgi:hypothetical protein|nr:hypothetical protein [Fibromonadaceae bacterium]